MTAWFPPTINRENMNHQAIIEIGIILKLIMEEIIEKYNVIKPDNFTFLNPRIVKLTGITIKKLWMYVKI